jgi:HEAT repeat protein
MRQGENNAKTLSGVSLERQFRIGPDRTMSQPGGLRAAMKDSVKDGDWGERTTADLAGLLVELGRVLKAAAYYGADARTTVNLADRASRAWRSDLARAGPLELEVTPDGFRIHGLPGAHGADHLRDAARALAEGGVQRVRFTEVLSAESLASFAESLGNLDVEQRPASQLGIEVDGEICFDLSESGPESPTVEMQLSADSLGGSLLSASRPAAPLPVGPDLSEDVLHDPEPPPPNPSDDDKPEPLEHPLTAPATDPDDARLVQALQALDRCTEDDEYIQLASSVATSVRVLSDDGRSGEANRAMLVLADHAMGAGGRSGVQARVSRATLLDLATGNRLAELIDSACSRDTTASVRAAQVLLTLGEHAVPALLERLEEEPDDQRAGQLTGLLIALGEASVPALTAAIGSGTGHRARLAIQLAGDLQCPGLVQPLRDLLCAKEGHLHREAARSLVEMGNSTALRVLLEALESKYDRTAEIAAFSLGTLGAPRSLSALMRRLERATEDRRWELVREILLAMAQFHQGDRATARGLLAWVQRGGPPWRRPDLDLKLEAVTTLGQLGGEHTTAALREIAGLRLPARLCERARRILDRRGDGRLTPR